MVNTHKYLSKKASDSTRLEEAFTDFMLSRQAMRCSEATVKFYDFTLSKFLNWVAENGVETVTDITSVVIRGYLVGMIAKGLSSSYIHSHARVIRAFVRFLHYEEYIEKVPKFEMPTIDQVQRPLLREEQLERVIKACNQVRDKAVILLMVDTGVRRDELCQLNWGHINMKNGVVQIAKGKGGKARTVVMGKNTRRAILKYRRTVESSADLPLIQTMAGGRFTHSGLRSYLLRISEEAGVHINPHMLRRTFATLSIKNRMNIVHLQGLMGHSTIEMTKKYVELIEDDLLDAHEEHGPIDNLL